jgi:hypothetical protein
MPGRFHFKGAVVHQASGGVLQSQVNRQPFPARNLGSFVTEVALESRCKRRDLDRCRLRENALATPEDFPDHLAPGKLRLPVVADPELELQLFAGVIMQAVGADVHHQGLERVAEFKVGGLRVPVNVEQGLLPAVGPGVDQEVDSA